MTGYYRIRNLRQDYNPQDSSNPPAIDIARLDIDLGGIIAIVGGSGSGKTTFLNLISGLEEVANGGSLQPVLDLKLANESAVLHLAPSSNSGKQHAFPHNRVSYIFQQGYLLNQASIGINLAMTRRAAGLKADRISLEKLLTMAQLHEDSDNSQQLQKTLSDRTFTLSGGQQQRINIARALGREPDILFADELSSSLDPHRARLVLTELRNWLWEGSYSAGANRRNLNRTMLWVTHDYELASNFADAIIVLHEGTVAEHCERPIECNENRPAIKSSDLLLWVKTGHIPQAYREPSDDSVLVPEAVVYEHRVDAENINRVQEISPLQIITGNIGSGIALSWLEAFPLPRPTGSRIVGFARGLTRPLFGFSHWARALQLAAVILLIMIITYGREVVIAYFDAQLNDPALRHVIVQQNTKELQRSIIDDDSLHELSTSISSSSGTSSNDESVAFGRFTEFVDAYPKGIDETNPGYIAEITVGVLDREEPVYHSLAVFPLDALRPGCTNDTTQSPIDLIPYSDELALIVSQNYIREVEKIYSIDLCSNPFLDLWDAGSPRRFRVVGYVQSAPADGYEQFDAIMQVGVWRNWVSLVGKSQIESFSRAAVYFTQSNHAGVIEELYKRAFAFDREIVNKFERLIGTAAKLRDAFFVINWLSLIVAGTVAAGLIWSYLVQNAKSIAVLRAHAAWVWPLVAAIPFQLLLTFFYSMLYIAFVIILWNWLAVQSPIVTLVANLTSGAWAPAQVSWSMVKTTLPWVFASLVAMLLVGWVCLLVWRLTHRRLAHDLNQAY